MTISGHSQDFCDKMYVGNAPNNLIEKTLMLRDKKLSEIRTALLAKIQSISFKFYCSLCLIIRDENEYLEEWLQWHIQQGVEHFYIYDHDSKNSVAAFIKTLGSDIEQKSTVIDWKGAHNDAQPDAYNDCLKRFREESRWIGFVDADEQVRLKTGQTLPQFLKGYECYAGIFAVWITYDANGAVTKTAGSLRERFPRINTVCDWINRAGKVFVQPNLMREMVIHNGSPENGFYVVDEHKRKIPAYSLVCDKATSDYICVDHYYTKSYEEWKSKIKRGGGHAKCQRRYDEFFVLNSDMEYCRENIQEKQKYECSDKAVE